MSFHEHAHHHEHHHEHGHEHHHGHHHEHQGGHPPHREGRGHPHGRHAGRGDERPATLRVKEGDVLACGCGSCDVELTVTRACEGDACGTGCEVAVSCCGEPMRPKAA